MPVAHQVALTDHQPKEDFPTIGVIKIKLMLSLICTGNLLTTIHPKSANFTLFDIIHKKLDTQCSTKL